MSVMSVLEFERATAMVTFDMPVSKGITFTLRSMEILWIANEKSIQSASEMKQASVGMFISQLLLSYRLNRNSCQIPISLVLMRSYLVIQTHFKCGILLINVVIFGSGLCCCQLKTSVTKSRRLHCRHWGIWERKETVDLNLCFCV